jgi:hypothetical protein
MADPLAALKASSSYDDPHFRVSPLADRQIIKFVFDRGYGRSLGLGGLGAVVGLHIMPASLSAIAARDHRRWADGLAVSAARFERLAVATECTSA